MKMVTAKHYIFLVVIGLLCWGQNSWSMCYSLIKKAEETPGGLAQLDYSQGRKMANKVFFDLIEFVPDLVPAEVSYLVNSVTGSHTFEGNLSVITKSIKKMITINKKHKKNDLLKLSAVLEDALQLRELLKKKGVDDDQDGLGGPSVHKEVYYSMESVDKHEGALSVINENLWQFPYLVKIYGLLGGQKELGMSLDRFADVLLTANKWGYLCDIEKKRAMSYNEVLQKLTTGEMQKLLNEDYPKKFPLPTKVEEDEDSELAEENASVLNKLFTVAKLPFTIPYSACKTGVSLVKGSASLAYNTGKGLWNLAKIIHSLNSSDDKNAEDSEYAQYSQDQDDLSDDDVMEVDQKRQLVQNQLVKQEKLIQKIKDNGTYRMATAKFYRDLLNGTIDKKILEFKMAKELLNKGSK